MESGLPNLVRLEDARLSAAKAVAMCRKAGANQRLVRALMLLQIEHTMRYLADLHCEVGNLNVSEGFYKESLGIYRKERDASPGDLANAVRGFAVMKDSAGATEHARVLWEEARGLYSTLGVDEGVKECDARLVTEPSSS